jgi:hypothetical protein
MELNEALTQLTEIRSHLARTEVFRGFRSVTVACSAVTALAAGLFQAVVIPAAAGDAQQFLLVWISAATISILLAGVAIVCRASKASTGLERETTLRAVEQFAPCLLAGAIVTASLYYGNRESCWLLPGLWPILFSLGVFACYRSIDPSMFLVGGFYLLTGMGILLAVPHDTTFSPWIMAGTFGIGQALAASLLYCRLERRHG